jgi:hypothetical protein
MVKPAPNRGKDKPFRVYPLIAPDLYDRLRVRAERNNRTLRAEVTTILGDVIRQEEQPRETAL